MKRHALFVGVNSYDDKTIRPLRFSIPDASVLQDRFRGLGYETRLLPDPSAAELRNAVEESVEGLGPGDVFLFFFAGHGFTAQDGQHLLFCRDDRQKLLRVNGAGVRVDELELLTEDGGFHRAFLLDSCRSDCFADRATRGAETRDLDFVSPVAHADGEGSFFLLRSCDRFRPSLEFTSLGHGLFTQGLLDALDARDPRLARCGTDFLDAVRERMEKRQVEPDPNGPQRPSLGEFSGPAFSLFGEGFFKAGPPPSDARPTPVSVPVLVLCPVCGKKNEPKDTFRCKECGRDNLCLAHRDERSFLCGDCAAKAREEAERKRREVLDGAAPGFAAAQAPSKDPAARHASCMKMVESVQRGERSSRFWLVVPAMLVIGAAGLLWALRPKAGPQTNGKEPPMPVSEDSSDLRALYSLYGLTSIETNGVTLLRGDFATRAERLAATAAIYEKNPGTILDFADRETLLASASDLLSAASDGALQIVDITNRVAVLAGRAPDPAFLNATIEALRDDIPRLSGIDTASVVLDAPVASGASSTPALSTRHLQRPRLPLLGILMKPYPCLVLQNGQRLAVGAEINGYTIERITQDRITLRREGGDTIEWMP